MAELTCGHFNFTVRDTWILCSDCGRGININSEKGQQLLARKRGYHIGLTSEYRALQRSFIDSYQELIQCAGTTDPEALARYVNEGGKE